MKNNTRVWTISFSILILLFVIVVSIFNSRISRETDGDQPKMTQGNVPENTGTQTKQLSLPTEDAVEPSSTGTVKEAKPESNEVVHEAPLRSVILLN